MIHAMNTHLAVDGMGTFLIRHDRHLSDADLQDIGDDIDAGERGGWTRAGKAWASQFIPVAHSEPARKSFRMDWPALLLTVTLALVLLIFPFANQCQTEDAFACTWSAAVAGNGTGGSFIDYYGITLYHPTNN